MCLEVLHVGQRKFDVHGPGSYLAGPSTANQVASACGVCSGNPTLISCARLFTLVLHSCCALLSCNCKQTTALSRNYKVVRPQRCKGIKQYIPIHRFHEAVLDMQTQVGHFLYLHKLLVCSQAMIAWTSCCASCSAVPT